MKARDLQIAAQALYGEFWRMPFEDEFNMSRRKLLRILAEDEIIGYELESRIKSALTERKILIDNLLKMLNGENYDIESIP